MNVQVSNFQFQVTDIHESRLIALLLARHALAVYVANPPVNVNGKIGIIKSCVIRGESTDL